MPISVCCYQCGQRLLRSPSRIGKHVFCNKECRRLFITLPLEERFWRQVVKTATCWLWNGATTRQGYGTFSTVPLENNPRRYRMEPAHRVAWKLTRGKIPDGLNVCHNCPEKDNPLCVNPDHLFLGTQMENIQDAIRKNGKPLYNVKLTEDQARMILSMKGIKSQQALGVEYGVSAGCVQRIHERKTWKYLDICAVEELGEGE